MTDHLKYLAKLFSSSAFSFFKINILGQFLIAFISIISLFTIIYQSSNSGIGHTSGLAIIIFLFTLRPIGFSLTVLSLFMTPFVLFSFGNKYVISKTIHKLISDKGEVLLFPILDKVITKIKANQPNLLKQGADAAQLKLKLIQEIRDSKENKWLKKILVYGFKKVNLDDVDFTDEKLILSDVIKTKIVAGLKNISEPSRNFFWIILGIQITIMVLVISQVI